MRKGLRESNRSGLTSTPPCAVPPGEHSRHRHGALFILLRNSVANNNSPRAHACIASTLFAVFYVTGHGAASQISDAYWAIVRSLENLPEAATFRIALRDQ